MPWWKEKKTYTLHVKLQLSNETTQTVRPLTNVLQTQRQSCYWGYCIQQAWRHPAGQQQLSNNKQLLCYIKHNIFHLKLFSSNFSWFSYIHFVLPIWNTIISQLLSTKWNCDVNQFLNKRTKWIWPAHLHVSVPASWAKNFTQTFLYKGF